MQSAIQNIWNCSSIVHIYFHFQLLEHKKKLESEAGKYEEFEEMKKKMSRDTEALQHKVQALTDENDRLNKSKKKQQSEVSCVG